MPKRFMGSVPRPTPKRFRVSVPETDESVLAWIGAQSDLSNSVRALIRESIEKNGYRDATCYPVVQQPRRGRPPKNIEDEADVTTVLEPVAQPDEMVTEPVAQPAAVPMPVHEEPAYEAPAQTNVEDVLGTLR
jgi:hypothetical protein